MTNVSKSGPRAEPRQARGQARIRQILDATCALLVKNEDITTSMIADHANIPVGSVYRYFPNLLGIYRTLFEEINGDLRQRIQQRVDTLSPDQNWVDLFNLILVSAAELYEERPAYGNLLMIISTPALQDVRQDCINTTSKIFKKRWAAGKDGFHGGDACTVAVTAASLFTFVEESYFACKHGRLEEAVYAETIKSLKTYLGIYLR